MTPSVGRSGATEGAIVASCRRASTIGAAADARSPASPLESAATACAIARSWTMTAKGFHGRALRSRSLRTAASSRASQRSWKPPTPFRATTRPSRRPAIARASASSRVARVSPSSERRARLGPQRGQLIVCAWKRRSEGSRYSRAQSSQSGKSLIVVASRSKGSRVAIA